MAAGLGLKYVEIRSAWGVNILDLDDDQLATVQETLAEHGLKVSSIGSPIGKIFIDEDFEPHLERACGTRPRWRKPFGAPYIRIFSFFIRAGDDPDDHRDEVLRRMRALADVGRVGRTWSCVHENEKEIYGDIPRRCLDIVESVGSPNLRAGLGPGELRPGRGPPLHRGVRVAASAPRVHADQGRPRGRRDGRGRRRRRRRGGRDDPRAARRTASTGSSPSSRTWATSTRSAASPAPSCSPRPGRPSPSCCRTKGSSTHEHGTEPRPSSSPSSARGSSASSTAR